MTEIIESSAQKWGVKIYKQSNNGNHLHLGLKLSKIARWSGFIRELTGRIALLMKQLGMEGKFWACRPFTRVVAGWGKAFRLLREYIKLNQWEAEGYISRSETKSLKDLRQLLAEFSTA